jgi:[protein-PII] uridylyltransferase
VTGELPKLLAGIDGDALRKELSAVAQAGSDKRKMQLATLKILKRELHAARAKAKHAFEAGEIDGAAAAVTLSDIQDAIIQVLYDLVRKHFYYAPNPTEGERIAIVATGGYGRRQLAPRSDIDLLFVRPYKQTAWGESVIELILQMLWDMGLKVGHATRSLEECLRLARQDITISTALLEGRYICGDPQLDAHLRKRFRAEVISGNALHFASAKLAERDARHVRQGESRYLVEPNVKDGKGGLRDLQTLYWIGKYLYGVDRPADLIAHQVFRDDEFELFHKAEAFLWTVRFHLHYAAGRPEERLSFDLQPEMSRRFGGDGSRAAVELFMRRYFLVAKDVGDLTRIFCAALEEQNKKQRPTLSRFWPGFMRRKSPARFFVDNGRLNVRPDAFARDPVNLLRLFQIAEEREADIHPAALRSITRSLDLIDDTLRANPDANAGFVQILTSRRNPERGLRLLNESGILGRFVPEFGRVVGLMQFNMYHHYTVDEHLIRAVGNLAAIERGELKEEHPLASEIVHLVPSRKALYVAALLHDIAKGLPGDHSENGCAIAEQLCERWNLSETDTSAVVWLVRNHLVMSDTAQRRDIGDPKTVRDFVEKIESPALLRMLLVLTVADIRAVGPGVWNGWKGQLLRDLYRQAELLMTGREDIRDRSATVADAKRSVAERLGDFAPEARDCAVAHHSDTYWGSFEPDVQAQHARLVARLQTDGDRLVLSAKSDAFRSVTEIVVATADQPGLFALLAGAITGSSGSIVDAKIFTTSDGIALDVFSVQDMHGAPFGETDRLERLRRNILLALDGKPTERLRGRRQQRSSKFSIQPRVVTNNVASATATVIEVEAADRSGLLFDVTRAIADCGISISSAIVSTYGERAVDVFYVQDDGGKIADPERLQRIEAHLTKAASSPALEAATA